MGIPLPEGTPRRTKRPSAPAMAKAMTVSLVGVAHVLHVGPSAKGGSFAPAARLGMKTSAPYRGIGFVSAAVTAIPLTVVATDPSHMAICVQREQGGPQTLSVQRCPVGHAPQSRALQ